MRPGVAENVGASAMLVLDVCTVFYTSRPIAPTAASVKKSQLFLICRYLLENAFSMKKIAAIFDWSISTRKCRIHIHYPGVFSGNFHRQK